MREEGGRWEKGMGGRNEGGRREVGERDRNEGGRREVGEREGRRRERERKSERLEGGGDNKQTIQYSTVHTSLKNLSTSRQAWSGSMICGEDDK